MKKLIISTVVLAALTFVACKKDNLQPTGTSIEQLNNETLDEQEGNDDKWAVDARENFIGNCSFSATSPIIDNDTVLYSGFSFSWVNFKIRKGTGLTLRIYQEVNGLLDMPNWAFMKKQGPWGFFAVGEAFVIDLKKVNATTYAVKRTFHAGTIYQRTVEFKLTKNANNKRINFTGTIWDKNNTIVSLATAQNILLKKSNTKIPYFPISSPSNFKNLNPQL